MFFSIQPPLLKVLHKDFLKIREIFGYVKMENGFLDNTKKTRHKTGTHFETQLYQYFILK